MHNGNGSLKLKNFYFYPQYIPDKYNYETQEHGYMTISS